MFKTFQHLRWIIVGLTAVVLFHVTTENIAAKKWETVSQLPTGRSAFSTAVVDGKIYLIGGTLFENESSGPFGLSTVEVYNPHNNSWKKLPICQRLDPMQEQQSWTEKSMSPVDSLQQTDAWKALTF